MLELWMVVLVTAGGGVGDEVLVGREGFVVKIVKHDWSCSVG